MTTSCVWCKRTYIVSCTDEQYLKWKTEGMLIQDAMPNVPPEERELLISGYCNDCWNWLLRVEKEEEKEEKTKK